MRGSQTHPIITTGHSLYVGDLRGPAPTAGAVVAQLQMEGVVEEGEDGAAVAAPSDPPLAQPGGQRRSLPWEHPPPNGNSSS